MAKILPFLLTPKPDRRRPTPQRPRSFGLTITVGDPADRDQ